MAQKYSRRVAALAFVATLALVGMLATGWAKRPRSFCGPWNQLTVRVESVPAGAAVHVDGRPVGQAPLVVKQCRDRRHNIRVSQPGYVSWEWSGVLSSPLALDAHLLHR